MRISRWLTVVLALAVILRVAVAFYLGDSTPPAKDETSYSVLAERLATGHGYSFPVDWYPFARADAPTSHWSFLYTAVVAAVYWAVGTHPLAVRLLQAVVCGLLLPWLAYRLTRRLFPVPDGRSALPLLTALLAAVYAYFILYGAMVQTEALFICSVLWSLERALTLDTRLATQSKNPGLAWTAFTLGLSLGVATLLRQSILPWVPLLCLWLLMTGWRAKWLRSSAIAVMIVITVAVLCILPFTLRNLHVYGDFLLLNSNTGYAMYSAQHPLHGVHFQAYLAAPLPAELLGKGLNEPQWDRALMQRGIGFVIADPARYLLLSLSRIGEYFEFWPTPDSSLLFNLGRLASFTLLLPFMLVGIYAGGKGRRSAAVPIQSGKYLLLPDPVALALLFVLFYSLLHIFTWAMSRYRLPVDAVLLPFAALGLVMAAKWVERLLGVRRRMSTQITSLSDSELRR